MSVHDSLWRKDGVDSIDWGKVASTAKTVGRGIKYDRIYLRKIYNGYVKSYIVLRTLCDIFPERLWSPAMRECMKTIQAPTPQPSQSTATPEEQS